MSDFADAIQRLHRNRATIARLRRSSRKTFGRDKAGWPVERLELIQALIEKYREDERTVRAEFDSGGSEAA